MQATLAPTIPLAPNAQATPFCRLFEAQVANCPNSTAIEFEGRSVTYQELNTRANQLAHYLIKRGFAAETRIGICLDRSIGAIECMLGILKAGLAFVPLDPEFPPERLAYIVQHAGIEFIFADADYRRLFSEAPDRSLQVELPSDIGWQADTKNPEIDVALDALAYVMYTSGSTGKPKGVQIEHGSLITYCLADVELYRLTAEDRTLQFSTLNFDIAIEEIFPPLLVGSTVVVRPRNRSESSIELSHWIDNYSITALHIATAYWHEWVDLMAAAQVRVPLCLRLVIVTGEKISVEHYRRWKALCDHELLWCNAYGPTETTVTCTAFIPNKDWDADQMPIGVPLPGYQAYILNDESQPVAAGETGQLFIGGPALARGYLDRPDLTEKAFLHVTLPGELTPRRIYRTGDLARWLPAGEIEFAGRVDHQMKVGSYRIEPGEIEAVLNLHPAVRESLVVCEEHATQKYLVAHVVRTDSETCTPGQLAEFLRERLPAYMVPCRYALLTAMPKTINGKIDRAALPQGDQLEVSSPSVGNDQPRSEMEEELVALWRNVLHLPHIGIHDDFFQLGGSSLLVTRVIGHIASKIGVAVPVRDFFANPTIASLAAHLDFLAGRSSVSGRFQQQQTCQTIRARLPHIDSLEVDSLGARLACVHFPGVVNEHDLAQRTKSAKHRGHAVLIAQSYGHEYTRAHRNLQQLAVQLAQLGFDVFRFDYAGTGDSQGNEERLSVAQWKADIKQVTQAIRSQNTVNQLSVLGVRLGANLLAESGLESIQHFIAWDPIGGGAKFLERLRSMQAVELSNLTRYLSQRTSAPDELLGYSWPTQLQSEISELQWSSSARPWSDGNRSQHRWWLETATATDIRWSQTAAQRLHGDQAGPSTAAVKADRTFEDQTLAGIWNYQHVDDEIFWDELDFVNSAFASPAMTRAVIEILTSAG